MEIQKALHQISEIHGHLAKSHVYRGYRAVPVALSGVLALVAAAAPVYLYRDWAWKWVIAFPSAGIYLLGMFLFGLLSIDDFRRVIRAYRTRHEDAEDEEKSEEEGEEEEIRITNKANSGGVSLSSFAIIERCVAAI